MSGSYAEVVVDMTNRRVDRPYHYRVPPGLAPAVLPGVRVEVPFGRRRVQGLVWRLLEQPEVERTSDILRVLDAEPVLDRTARELAAWVAERYACSLAAAVRLLLPPGGEAERGMVGLRPGTWAGASRADAGWPLLAYLVARGGQADAGAWLRQAEAVGLRREAERLLAEGRLCLEGWGEHPRYHVVAAGGAGHLPARQDRLYREVVAGGPLEVREALRRAKVPPEVLEALLRAGLLAVRESLPPASPVSPLSLHDDQQAAVAAVRETLAAGGGSILLFGVAGSGKTEVYLEAARRVAGAGRQVLLLVPEIALTPQLLERVRARLGLPMAVLHSGLAEGERRTAWWRIRRGEVSLAVGTRSAVFAPFPDLGLIVVDEEQEAGYAQEGTPRYHAREVALFRARQAGAVCLLASATPSLESYREAVEGGHRLVRLPRRASGGGPPRVTVVDLRAELAAGNRGIFSRRLQASLRGCLERGEQALLFVNRRGYYPVVVCRDCGRPLHCPHCDLSLTHHASDNSVRCHYCGHRAPLPATCPLCGSPRIRGLGLGTQRVEDEVRRLFPGARARRVDSDVTGARLAHEHWYAAAAAGQVDVLVGTQMLGKGLDLPNLTLVGVVAADLTLYLPDFRAGEWTCQLLAQVAGRAGRGPGAGEVIIQTYAPQDPAIRAVQAGDVEAYYRQELAFRRQNGYPPYGHLLRLLVTGQREEATAAGARALAGELLRAGAADLLGPAFAGRRKDRYRWQITLRGEDAASLRAVAHRALQAWGLQSDGRVTATAELDPPGMA